MDTKYSKEDVSWSESDQEQWTIRPIVLDDNGETRSMLHLMSRISMGDMGEDRSLYGQFASTAQRVLSSEKLNPIKAILVPLTYIKSVNNQWIDNPDFGNSLFITFLNEMYMEVAGLEKQVCSFSPECTHAPIHSVYVNSAKHGP